MEDYLNLLESNLKKRLDYPLNNTSNTPDIWLRYSQFTYKTHDWETLIELIKLSIEAYKLPKKAFFYHCINQWYAHWSRIAIEEILKSIDKFIPSIDHKGQLVNLSLEGVHFAIKPLDFPTAYPETIYYSQHHPGEFIHWLERQHDDEPLTHCFYIVFCNSVDLDESWKLKAYTNHIAEQLSSYFRSFSPQNLITVTRQGKQLKGYADIIWIEE